MKTKRPDCWKGSKTLYVNWLMHGGLGTYAELYLIPQSAGSPRRGLYRKDTRGLGEAMKKAGINAPFKTAVTVHRNLKQRLQRRSR